MAAAFLVAALLGGGLLLAYTGDYEERIALASTALAQGTGEVRLQEVGENVEVELEVRGLPELREDEYYELWFVDDDGRMSGGTFQVRPEGRASVNFTAPAVARTYPTVGITREPDDGDPQSSGKKVLGGELQNS